MHWVARAVDDGGYVCFLKSVYGFPRYCAECTFSYAKSDACKLSAVVMYDAPNFACSRQTVLRVDVP